MTRAIKYIIFHIPKIAIIITLIIFAVACIISIKLYIERRKVIKDETRYEHQREKRQKLEQAKEKAKLEREKAKREEKIRKAKEQKTKQKS